MDRTLVDLQLELLLLSRDFDEMGWKLNWKAEYPNEWKRREIEREMRHEADPKRRYMALNEDEKKLILEKRKKESKHD